VTVAHRGPPLEAASVEEAIEVLRERGLRMTAARRLVVEALFAAEGLASAEQIAAGLDGRLPGSDVGSVYRNLERLEAIGLVRHVHLGHGPGLYMLAGRERAFAVCDACGRRRTIDGGELQQVRETVREQLGYEADFTHFPIVGLCSRCARREAQQERR
jgi:Fur family transcriptional regulator, ferric uptake regulator